MAENQEQNQEEEDEQVEEKKKEEEDGNKSAAAPTAIDVAVKLHAQIKSENDRHEQLLIRQEELAAQTMLGGSSDAGQAPPTPKELTDKEYTEQVMAGNVPETAK